MVLGFLIMGGMVGLATAMALLVTGQVSFLAAIVIYGVVGAAAVLGGMLIVALRAPDAADQVEGAKPPQIMHPAE